MYAFFAVNKKKKTCNWERKNMASSSHIRLGKAKARILCLHGYGTNDSIM